MVDNGAHLHHLHSHLTHSRAQLWEFNELIGGFHDFCTLLKRSGDFDHGYGTSASSSFIPIIKHKQRDTANALAEDMWMITHTVDVVAAFEHSRSSLYSKSTYHVVFQRERVPLPVSELISHHSSWPVYAALNETSE